MPSLLVHVHCLQALQTDLTAVRANLQTRNATLREAQASLSETEGKLHEEYEKSWELGRENMGLQQEVDRLKEDNRQIEQVSLASCSALRYERRGSA